MFFLSFLYQEPDPDTRRVVSLLLFGLVIQSVKLEKKKEKNG